MLSRIAVLSQHPEYYSTKRMLEAIAARGHEARLVDYLRCYLHLSTDAPRVHFQGEALTDIDAVVPRVSAAADLYGTAVVRQFEMMGVYCLNESQAIARARDKLRTLQLLARKGIGLPVTGCAHSTQDTDGLLSSVGGAPVVIKLLEGTQGLGVVLAETTLAARSVIDAFRNLDTNILVQEFIEEAKGADLRCFVVGDRVVAAMRRQGAEGEFRSNLHRGGSAEKVKLTPEERAMAVAAAKVMRLRVAGVDILRSDRGPLVMEVNASPGLEGIERTSGVDVAGAIVEFIEKDIESFRVRRREQQA